MDIDCIAHVRRKGERVELVFESAWRDPSALRGIEGFSHLWLVTAASASSGTPCRLAASLARLEALSPATDCGAVLVLGDCDLADGTPVFDVKPYLPYADSHPDAAAQPCADSHPDAAPPPDAAACPEVSAGRARGEARHVS